MFLNFGQVGGPAAKIQKHPLGGIFKNHTKSRPSNFTELERPFYEKVSNFDFFGSIHFERDFFDKIEMDFFFMSFISKTISYVFFCELFSKGLSLIKLKLVSFFIARYLTDSLRGPVLTLQNEALCAEFWLGNDFDTFTITLLRDLFFL